MIAKQSLIDKNNSLGWKGLLILLIVLGHTGLLCKYGSGENDFYAWRLWLYEFHVRAFFILPFLYGCKQMGDRELFAETRKTFVRLFVPYIWITGVCMVIQFHLGNSIDYAKAIWAFIIGSQGMLHEYMGFHFPWFLPTMFAVILIRNVYYNIPIVGKYVIAAMLLVVYSIDLGSIANYIPFNLINALRYAALGILVRCISVSFPCTCMKCGSVSVFVLSSIVFFTCSGILSNGLPIAYMVLSILLPLSFGCIIYAFQKYANPRVLKFVGKYSLQVYLFHVIVYNVLLHFSCSYFNSALSLGFLLYALTLLISLGMAVVIDVIPPVKRILFPR